MQVSVRDNNVDQALRALKKKLQREGVFREMKLRQHFEKPSEKKAREKAEAIRRAREHFTAGQKVLADRHAGEVFAEELRLAHQALGEITGGTSSDDLLGIIFTEFCIGK